MNRELKEPKLPSMKHISEYGSYRGTRQGYLDTALFKAAYNANEDNFYGKDEYKDMKFWDYDTRLNLEDLLKSIPAGVPIKDVYLNIRRDRACFTLEVAVVQEIKIDKKALAAEKKAAEVAYDMDLEIYRVAKATWDTMQAAEKIRTLEAELKKLKGSSK